MLQPGACDDRGIAMAPCEFGKACDGAVDIRQQRIDGGARGQHGGGIDHVLAGGAPVHIARRIGIGLGDVSGEPSLATPVDDDVRSLARSLEDELHVQVSLGTAMPLPASAWYEPRKRWRAERLLEDIEPKSE